MAKGKRAAALFEVIQAAKQKEQLRAQGGGFLTPKWWFKSKLKDSNGTPTPPAAPAPASQRADAPTKRTLPAQPAPIVPDISQPEPEAGSMPVAEHIDTDIEATSPETEDSLSATFTPEPVPPPVHHDFVDNEEPAMEDPKPVTVIKPARKTWGSTSARGSARKPVDVAVDRGRQQIVLRLSFTSAAISTFAVLVVIALIVLVTKSFTRGPSSADGSIATVKNGKVTPGVMSVFQGKGNDESSMNVTPSPSPLRKRAKSSVAIS